MRKVSQTGAVLVGATGLLTLLGWFGTRFGVAALLVAITVLGCGVSLVDRKSVV